MKKTIGILLTLTLLVSTVPVSFAKNGNEGRHNGQNKFDVSATMEAQPAATSQAITTQPVITQPVTTPDNSISQKAERKQQKAIEKQKKAEEKAAEKQQKADNKKLQITLKQSFKINGSPVIKYGKFKLPIRPITKGIGATLTFNKETSVLNVSKDAKTIVIDFKNKTVTVNGVADTTSTIFTATNKNKMTVLINYIANQLGARVKVDDNKVVTETDTTPVNDATGSAIVVTGSAITTN